MTKHLLPLLLVAGLIQADWQQAQATFPQNGVRDERPNHYAFTNATIVVDPQTTLQNATLVIREGRIVALGSNVPVPAGAVVANLAGRRIYPSLIDLDSDYGMTTARTWSCFAMPTTSRRRWELAVGNDHPEIAAGGFGR